MNLSRLLRPKKEKHMSRDRIWKRDFAFVIQAKSKIAECAGVTIKIEGGSREDDDPERRRSVDVTVMQWRKDKSMDKTCFYADIEDLYELVWAVRNAMPELEDE
jgi:hypothetical protein